LGEGINFIKLVFEEQHTVVQRVTNCNIDLDVFLDKVDLIVQSANILSLDNSVLEIYNIENPIGHLSANSIPTILYSIVTGYLKCNKEKKGCFFKSLGYGLLKRGYKGNQQKAFLRSKKRQSTKSYQVARISGIRYDADIGPRELEIISQKIGVRIGVFSISTGQVETIGRYGLDETKYKSYFFLLHNKTYYYLDKPSTIIGRFRNSNTPCAKFCEVCIDFYTGTLKKHLKTCKKMCGCCFNLQCNLEEGGSIECSKCLRCFRSENCLKLHLENKICKNLYICRVCSVPVDVVCSREKHVCYEIKCLTCYEKYKINENEPHICYITKPKNDNTDNAYVSYFDLETYLGPDKVHTTCLVVSHMICDLCRGSEDGGCDECGEREKVFGLEDSDNPVKAYIDYLIEFQKKKKSKNTLYAIAHNGANYDTTILYKTLLENYNENYIKKIILKGNTIISMKLRHNITLLDSLLYVGAALKKLPTIFGVDTVSKSFFPYEFLTLETMNYVGDIPNISFFEGQTDGDGFDEFFNSFNGDYDIQSELIKYCKMDVTVLRLCFEKFRSLVLELHDVDCIRASVTLPGLSFYIYRKNFMTEKLPIINRRFKRAKKHSFKSIHWLSSIEKMEGKMVEHGRSYLGESRIKVNGQYHYVDGVSRNVDGSVAEVFSFHGCLYHGCPQQECKFKSDSPLFHQKSKLDLYSNTLKLDNAISANYRHRVIWEHEYEDILKDGESELGRLMNESKMNTRNVLCAGESLRGGRTNANRLFYKAKPDEEICYVDFVSLYPYIQLSHKFPVGIPNISVGATAPTAQQFTSDIALPKYDCGLIHCRVLPPQDLYFPILPYIAADKLTFPLCAYCARKNKKPRCKHVSQLRGFQGVFTLAEMREAVENGYLIEKVFEIWSFPETSDIFSGYIKSFLKIKFESSGYPPTCVTDIEKQEFIDKIETELGIKLDPAKIVKNPGLRAISKLFLNSLWGRFCLNTEHSETQIINDYSLLLKITNDSSSEITNLHISNNKMIVTIKPNEEGDIRGGNVNVVIAAHVTSFARLRLWREINKLGDLVVYYDTDSIMHVKRPGSYQPVESEMLGGLKCELKEKYGVGSKGVRFASGGPKAYVLEVMKADGELERIVRAKGIRLNTKLEKDFTIEKFYNMIHDTTISYKIPQKKFTRMKYGGVFTQESEKTLRQTYSKRRISDYQSLTTEPFGYIPPTP
jgi:hypothetical protein